MKSSELVNKLKTLYLLQEKIGTCFGSREKIFCWHKLEKFNALEFRKIAIENDISLEEIQNIVSGYLYRTGVSPEHCKVQTDKASLFFDQKLMVA